MKVTVVGCSGSFAGPRSPASCYLVQAEHEGRTWNLVLDIGAGALGALQQHIDPRDLDAIFLSHLHPDHCIDLCGLYVVQRYHPEGPSEPVVVYGPTGTRKRMSEAYGLDDVHAMDTEFDYRDHVDREPVVVGPVHRHPVCGPPPDRGLRPARRGRRGGARLHRRHRRVRHPARR